jgi:nucleoside-diphosphate-sugar epimerase
MMALTESASTIGKTVNIGSGSEISIENLFHLICKIMKTDAKLVLDEKRIRPQNSEVKRLLCDNKLIKELCQYTPKMTLEDGLKQTVEWFTHSAKLSKYKSDRYNI